MKIRMGDYGDELVFYGDIAEERCAVCLKPAGTIDDVLYAQSWDTVSDVVKEEFILHRSCMFDSFRD